MMKRFDNSKMKAFTPAACVAMQQGIALLAVLWMSAALSLMAFSVAYVVRTEANSVSNQFDVQRAYFMARGAIESAVFALGRPIATNAISDIRESLDQFQPGKRWLRFQYEHGSTLVEVIPENSKLAINAATPDVIRSLFDQIEVGPVQGQDLTMAIVDWRSGSESSVRSAFDLFYASLPTPYTAKHASINDLEELLGVKGMTREVYFGSRDIMDDFSQGRLRALPDLFNLDSAQSPLNVNYASPQVLATLPGWDRQLANKVVERRRDDQLIGRPYLSMDDFVSRVPEAAMLVGIAPVSINSGSAYTLVATGQLDNSTVTITVRATVRIDLSLPSGYRILGWWEDWPWSPAPELILKASKELL